MIRYKRPNHYTEEWFDNYDNYFTEDLQVNSISLGYLMLKHYFNVI